MLPNQERLSKRARTLSDVSVDTSNTTDGTFLTQTSGVYEFQKGPLHDVDVVTTSGNIGLGVGVLADATGSSNNICVGHNAGRNVTTDGSVILGGPDNFIPGFADSAAGEAGVGHNCFIGGAAACSEATTPESRGAFSVCIGPGCALSGVGQGSVCVGPFASANGVCGSRSVILGDNAGGSLGSSNPVGDDSVCISTTTQCAASRSVCIGPNCNLSGDEGVCIGNQSSGFEHSVCLGNKASCLNGAILLNATNTPTSSAVSDSFSVRPIRTVDATDTSSENHVRLPLTSSGFSQILLYNPTTFEIKAVTLDAIV
jgi:hypothetical protein